MSRFNLSGGIKKNFRVGFSLTEILAVALITGILSATGAALYSGVIFSSRIETIENELNVFFEACRNRARMRKQTIELTYTNGVLSTVQTSLIRLRLPEITNKSASEIKTIYINPDGHVRNENGIIKDLEVTVDLPGNRREIVNIGF